MQRPNFYYQNPAIGTTVSNLSRALFGSAQDDATVARAGALGASREKALAETAQLQQETQGRQSLAELVTGIPKQIDARASEFFGPLERAETAVSTFGPEIAPQVYDENAPALASALIKSGLDTDRAGILSLLPGLTDDQRSRNLLATGETIGPEDFFSIQDRNENAAFNVNANERRVRSDGGEVVPLADVFVDKTQAEAGAANALANQRDTAAVYNTARSALTEALTPAKVRTEETKGDLNSARVETEGSKALLNDAKGRTESAKAQKLDAQTQDVLTRLPARVNLLNAQASAANARAANPRGRGQSGRGFKVPKMTSTDLEAIEGRMALTYDVNFRDFIQYLGQNPEFQAAFYQSVDQGWTESGGNASATVAAASKFLQQSGLADLSDIGPETSIPAGGGLAEQAFGAQPTPPPGLARGSTSSNPIAPTSQTDIDNAPSGTFFTINGKTYRKP